MAERFDVVVIGGGPAGSAAAITAARRGKAVLLLERGHFPRHKVCGEFVSAESLQLLSDLVHATGGAEILDNAVRIRRTRVFMPGGGFEAPIEPPAVSISRFDLDLALWNAAVASGVDARQDCGGYHIVQRRGSTYYGGRNSSVGCERIVYAAGRTPEKRSREPLVGIKAHFRADKPLDSVDLYFGKDGYCGVQPLGDGLVNVCALVRSDSLKRMGPERMTAAFAVHELLREVDWEQVTDTVATAWLSFGEPQPLRHGFVRAGDAAGFIDPFLGDGISLALQTGVLAGELDHPQAYADEYRSRFLPVFRRAAGLRILLAAPAPLQKTALLMMKWPGVARAVVERTRARARTVCALKRSPV